MYFIWFIPRIIFVPVNISKSQLAGFCAVAPSGNADPSVQLFSTINSSKTQRETHTALATSISDSWVHVAVTPVC